MSSQRSRVINLYKTLLNLGKTYPSGKTYFNKCVHKVFDKHKNENDPRKIEIMIAHAAYITKELEALQLLRKFRETKKLCSQDIRDQPEFRKSKIAIQLMKKLLYLGRDYPQGYDYFRVRLHNVFLKNSKEVDPEKIDKMIAHGNYIIKELEALYMLKKYRTLKRRYYNYDTPVNK